MDLKQAASLLGWPRDKTRVAIESGIDLERTGHVQLTCTKIGLDYDISDAELDAFIQNLEKEEPGRHPPLTVRRLLLIEARFKCSVCGSDAPLQYHHMIEWKELKHHDQLHMLAVCGTCHDKITRTGQIDYQSQVEIKKRLSANRSRVNASVEITPSVPTSSSTVIDQRGEDRIVWMLPRGFIMLEDITFQPFETWSVVADYYDFSDGWRYGTHYHPSYLRRWEEPGHLFLQCRKLAIPIGDWRYAIALLRLVQSLREASEPQDLTALVKAEQANRHPVLYFRPGERIILEELPRHHFDEIPKAPFRDIIAEIDLLLDDRDFQPDTKERVSSLRHRAFRIAWEGLGKDHPSMRFVEECVNKYRDSFSRFELKQWLEEYRRILADAFFHRNGG